MKKIFLLLFILNTLSSFAQKNHDDGIYATTKDEKLSENFSVEKNVITWKKVFEFKENPIPYLKQNSNLKFKDSIFGTADNLLLRCRNISFYCKNDFQINFKIETKENKYRVTVSNIVFKNAININFGGVSTDDKLILLEEAELRFKDNTIRKNNQSVINLNCIDEFLTELFTIKIIEDKW